MVQDGKSCSHGKRDGVMAEIIRSFSEPRISKAAFELQQMIFKVTRAWLSGVRSAVTDQVRRAAHSIGVNISEAWAKRKYPAHFASRLPDADGELPETSPWPGHTPDTDRLPRQIRQILKHHETKYSNSKRQSFARLYVD